MIGLLWVWLTFGQAVSAYTLLAVTRGPSWQPSINNGGEIVYLALDPQGFPNVFSTLRGQLTFSTTGHLRFPSLNDAGEVVYADRVAPFPHFRILSTERGVITPELQGNQPAINHRGEVVFSHSVSAPVGIRTNLRGLVRPIRSGPVTKADLNDAGEIVFRHSDARGVAQIFSTRRGQLTREEAGWVGTPAINNAGEVVYVRDGQLVASDGHPIFRFAGRVGFGIDMNDRGDIVFAARGEEGGYRIVLATRRPEDFPAFGSLGRARGGGPPMASAIDVDPGSGENEIPIHRRGLLPVAILTTRSAAGEALEFDASLVDPLSVRLGRKRAGIVVRSMSKLDDVDGDGDLDLVLYFRLASLGLRCGDESLSLAGVTEDGAFFTGADRIRVVGCREAIR